MMPQQPFQYLRDNLGQSRLASPFRAPLKTWELVPMIIHWVTVSVWVLFLGGRNLVLEL